MAPGEPRRRAPRALRVDVVGGAVSSRAGLGRWLARVAPARARGELSVAIVSDHRVRTLNRAFRGLNRATDVLSFASSAHPGRRSIGPRAQAPGPFLGDIVIAHGVASRQARRAGHGLGVELRILALHGLLHLLGYDHDRDRGTMARVERRLRIKGGLGDALIERAGRERASA
jgi:probable rRNA maturation factor